MLSDNLRGVPYRPLQSGRRADVGQMSVRLFHLASSIHPFIHSSINHPRPSSIPMTIERHPSAASSWLSPPLSYRWSCCVTSDSSDGLTHPFRNSLLVTFSTPYIRSIYFLSQSSIRYGTFGWCDTSNAYCLTQFGYRWEPQVIQWLVKAQQVLIPMCKETSVAQGG